MCPACIASTAVVVSGVVSTGGVAALAAKILRSNKSDKAKSEPAINSTERRMNDADSNF